MNPDEPTPENNPSQEPATSLGRLQDGSSRCVRENPVWSVVGALAAGIVVGWMLPHRQPTWRERYLDEPMGRMRGWLGGAADAAADHLHSAQEGAQELAGHAVSAAKRGLEKLRCW